MSDEDYENGKNGHFWSTSNHEYNYDYQRGVSDSITESEAVSALTDSLLGHGGSNNGPALSSGKKIIIFFLYGLCYCLFCLLLQS
jgi:hypothetical protein